MNHPSRGTTFARPFSFTVEQRDTATAARSGRLVTPHAVLPTPVFMPVGTAGSVKAVTFEQVAATGAQLILGNTYHLYLRPGHELVSRLGGLHRFLGWDGAVLTDSAGFQVFSLGEMNRVTDNGVEFRSHLDGSRHFFSPELSIEVQIALGADIVMAFDQCVRYGADAAEVAAGVERTSRWLERCCTVLPGRSDRAGYEQVLFGIMQGGLDPEQRRHSAAAVVAADLPGYAIGGLSVGEPPEAMHEMTELAASLLPADRPRYLMGVGFPDDIVAAVRAGVDMFDCVLPTRMGRTGTALTWDGRLVVKNQIYATDERPLAEDCACPTCRRHTRAYLRHLFQAGEVLALTLATVHNLHFYQELMRRIRAAIRNGDFAAFAAATTARWREGERRRRHDRPERGR